MSLLLSNRAIIGSMLPVMEFQTNKSGTFNPSFTISSGTLIWDFGDGSELYEGNSPNHTYSDSSTKTVKIYQNDVDISSTISAINFSSQNIIGTLDFSWHNINGTFYAHLNTSLTSITFSGSGNTSNSFLVHSCNLSSLDVGGFTFSGIFYAYSNSSLTSITLGINYVTTGISQILINICNLSIPSVDDIFSKLNTYFSSNTPIKDLTVNTSGGTNGIPTGGASNTDILNLASIFTGAGYLFTAIINT